MDIRMIDHFDGIFVTNVALQNLGFQNMDSIHVINGGDLDFLF